MVATVDRAREVVDKTLENVERVIVGKRAAAELALTAVLGGGHLLIEDVPGVGKTMLARSVAVSLGASFKRVQFTPDLLPTDVIGVNLYNQRTGEFEFRAGPVLAHILLADEINRGTPKTQSALLEAMEEGQVTVDGVTHPLPQPFHVIATQNPLEHEGTFLLPEAQRDRFFLRLSLGYPTVDSEMEIMDRTRLEHPIDTIEPVTSPEEALDLQQTVRHVYVDDLIKKYIVDIVDGTREHGSVYVGASPRGALTLFRGGQARAVMDGRDYVLPDDIKLLVSPILGHRIILNPNARMQGITPDDVLSQVLERVPVPGAVPRGWLRN